MVRSVATFFAIASLGFAAAAPVRREVPQEHSHEETLRICNEFLKIDNPDNISDCVFGLLGNAAALQGIGKFAGGPDCLQTGTADRAYTNAKAKGDVKGMTNALIYRSVERNTAGVGVESVLCTQFTPVNKEIAALTQHQDPASDGAAAKNKAIALELARQIKASGGDPLDALKSGTFAPGKLGDPTGAGNTCDDPNDAKGCIFTLNRIVFDATPEEIAAAVGGDAGGAGGNAGGNAGDNAGNNAGDNAGDNAGNNAGDNAGNNAGDNAGADCPEPSTTTVTVTETPAPTQANNNLDTDVCPVPQTKTVTVTGAAAPTKAPDANAPAPAPTKPANTGALAFGTCTDPSVIFGAGFENRAADEFTFLPNNLGEFPHGSAKNPDIIFESNCNTLVNNCGLKREDEAVTVCQRARTDAKALGFTGAAADFFNDALGFKTDFAALDKKRRRSLRFSRA